MHPAHFNLWILPILVILFFILKRERMSYATLVEKTVRYENRAGQPTTTFFCTFWLHTGPFIVWEVDIAFFNQVPVGHMGVVYRKGRHITGLNFQARH